jgi:hypothetical protein
MKINPALAALFIVYPIFADSISVNFSGTIASSSLPGVGAGDPFSGSFTYETTGTILGSGSASINYGFFLTQDGVVINVDGFSFGGVSYLNMNITDPPFTPVLDQNVDYLQVSSDGVFGSLNTNYSGVTLDSVLAQFGVDPILVPSNAIPNPFNLANVVIPGSSSDPAQVGVHLDNGSMDFFLLGNIASVEVVPEPATFGLVGMVLSASVLLRRVGARTHRQPSGGMSYQAVSAAFGD